MTHADIIVGCERLPIQELYQDEFMIFSASFDSILPAR